MNYDASGGVLILTNSLFPVQYAGNKDPFRVTVILSCVQLISVLLTATSTDQFGRRPLTIYPYAITSLSVLCLGIIGCFNYTTPALSSLLVSLKYGLNRCDDVLTLQCRFSSLVWQPSQPQVPLPLGMLMLRKFRSSVCVQRLQDSHWPFPILLPSCLVSARRR